MVRLAGPPDASVLHCSRAPLLPRYPRSVLGDSRGFLQRKEGKPPGVSQDGPPIASNWSVPAAELGGPVLDQHEAAGGGVVIHATGQEKALAVSVGDMERPWGPGVLRSWGSRALARPKSRTLTVPLGVTLTLAGLRSRWTIPCSWASSSALATCAAIWRASSGGTPCPMSSPNVAPSTSSTTRKWMVGLEGVGV